VGSLFSNTQKAVRSFGSAVRYISVYLSIIFLLLCLAEHY
jgi:hypothetical protein